LKGLYLRRRFWKNEANAGLAHINIDNPIATLKVPSGIGMKYEITRNTPAIFQMILGILMTSSFCLNLSSLATIQIKHPISIMYNSL